MYAAPGTPPTGAANGVAISPNGEAVAVAHETSPFVTVYPFSVLGFGAKFTNPASLPSGAGNAVAFSPDGAYLAVATDTGTVEVYPWSSAGFGTKESDPGITGDGYDVEWSPDGAYIAFSTSGTDIQIWSWSSGWGSETDDHALDTNAQGLAWSPDGADLAWVQSSTPYIEAAPVSAGVVGAQYGDPANPPDDVANAVVWDSDGDRILIATDANSPAIAYDWSSGFGVTPTTNGTGPDVNDIIRAGSDWVGYVEADDIHMIAWVGNTWSTDATQDTSLATLSGLAWYG